MFGKQKQPLFGKNICPACCYCSHSSTKNDLHCLLGNQPHCAENDSCKKFDYDPLRRIPRNIPPLPKVDAKDFTL